VIEKPAGEHQNEARFLIPFRVDRKRAVNAVKKWIGGRGLFVQSSFKKATAEVFSGIYLPAYLYNARAYADYSASIGENYTTTETYTTTDSEGKTVVRTRTVTHTEWRSLSGQFAKYVVDIVVSASKGVNVLVSASKGLSSNETRGIAKKYDLESGTESPITDDGSPPIVEQFDVQRSFARGEIYRGLGGMAHHRVRATEIPGSRFRNVHATPMTTGLSSRRLGFPAYVIAYRYHNKLYRAVIAGQGGIIVASAPYSVFKIVLAALVAIAAAVLLNLVISR
jgi:hypothetical protein